MNEAPDPLEAELAALRPHDVSPGLRRRIAEELAEDLRGLTPPARRGLTPPARRGRRWWFAAAGLAAACLGLAIWWWTSGRPEEPRPIVEGPKAAALVENSPPTLWAYERALAHSPEELDALLDRQAAAIAEPDPELVRGGVLTRSNAVLNALLGDD